MLYSAIYLIFFVCGAETFERLYGLLVLGTWDPGDDDFWNGSPGQESQHAELLQSLLLAGLPHLLMLWMKTIIGLRVWCIDDFSRKSVERYFMYTFVYHTYTIVNNMLLFAINAADAGRPSADPDSEPGAA